MVQCKAVTKEGYQCKNQANNDSGFCGIHFMRGDIVRILKERATFTLDVPRLVREEVPNLREKNANAVLNLIQKRPLRERIDFDAIQVIAENLDLKDLYSFITSNKEIYDDAKWILEERWKSIKFYGNVLYDNRLKVFNKRTNNYDDIVEKSIDIGSIYDRKSSSDFIKIENHVYLDKEGNLFLSYENNPVIDDPGLVQDNVKDFVVAKDNLFVLDNNGTFIVYGINGVEISEGEILESSIKFVDDVKLSSLDDFLVVSYKDRVYYSKHKQVLSDEMNKGDPEEFGDFTMVHLNTKSKQVGRKNEVTINVYPKQIVEDLERDSLYFIDENDKLWSVGAERYVSIVNSDNFILQFIERDVKDLLLTKKEVSYSAESEIISKNYLYRIKRYCVFLNKRNELIQVRAGKAEEFFLAKDVLAFGGFYDRLNLIHHNGLIECFEADDMDRLKKIK